MNIFMILCDELRADSLGYSGNDIIKTPNIDSLTKDSVIFENSYCNSPMCVPSRVSIATGRHAQSHGAVDNKLTPFDDEISFYSILQKNGYKTLNQGKWHCNKPEDQFGFDKSNNGKHKQIFPETNVTCFGITDKELRKTTPHKRNNGEIPLILHGIRPSHKDNTLDSVVTRNFLDDISELKNDDTFFARLSIMDPHTPYIPSEPFASMYDPDELPLPDSFNENLDSKPTLQRYFHTARGFDKLTEEDYRKSKASYYGLVSHVDERVGTVIEKIKELGLYEDSMIIFTADHGSMMGEHGFVEKWGHMYEQVVKTPLFIKFPKGEYRGKRLNSYVENIDLMPTILELCNLNPPKNIHGKSLMPYIKGEVNNHKDEVYAQYYCGGIQNTPALMVKDDNWKCTSYPEGNSMEEFLYMDHPLRLSGFFDKDEVLGELYDMKNDPDENINLFDNPEYLEVKNKYLDKIDKWQSSIGPVADTATCTTGNKAGLFTLIQGEGMNKLKKLFINSESLSQLKREQ